MRPALHTLLVQSLPRVFVAKAEILGKFWTYVFEQRPEYRPHSRVQTLAQRAALEEIMGKVIRALNSPEEFAAAIEDLKGNARLTPLKAQDSIVLEYAMARALEETADARLTPEEMAAWREYLNQFRVAMDGETGLRHHTDRHRYLSSRKSSIP